ncbi:ABC transporter ATP-binding protein [Caproicibacterium amylolyticum]|uniref:ATP-binding cassette domain-containing protein n=1 Tax=Caproicibacterium amylolyticum TaxID=2766537 RepID=A0A7G9WFE0_9FIRM|nr:oligopeptide/dipeptide ABC transporter ATP-binding protein [Caproicibacterium amylolyticum]QNO17402.1 ATP-binding cassette domain-containing protein [Caproicibacterium amylolyticum]
MDKEKLITLEHISKHFHVGKKQTLVAVNDITMDIYKGETLGVVGESGCGKSTLGRVVMGIYHPTKGVIKYREKPVDLKRTKDRFAYSEKAQIIFQDPYASLDPRMTVGTIISEGMEIHNMYDAKKRQERVYELLETVGLNREHANRFPHEFSGGQRQRIGIARALAIEPEFIVCDEPISALDVSIQSQIINLLKELQQKLGLTYMFIAHDLNIVKYISDRIAVMYLGNLLELANSDEIYSHTLHPYSKALLAAVPIPDPDKEAQKKIQVLSGDVPSPINPKPGCPFASRCPYADDTCRTKSPELREVRPNHFVACHKVEVETN